ncbi:hypothetical protein K2Z84_30200 [Candidatus Binatia bacterium]|nr:hypothetical protein [Candidatus Binatia bacterium]
MTHRATAVGILVGLLAAAALPVAAAFGDKSPEQKLRADVAKLGTHTKNLTAALIACEKTGISHPGPGYTLAPGAVRGEEGRRRDRRRSPALRRQW